MSGPHFCTPCGRYHPPGDPDCQRRRPPAPTGRDVDWAAAQVASERIAAVSSPDYVAAWREGYYSALRDRREREAAA